MKQNRLPGYGFARMEVPDWQPDTLLPRIFEEALGKPGKARRASSKVLDRIEVVSTETFRPQSAQEVLDEFLAHAAVAEILRYVAPAYQLPADMVFDVRHDTVSGFQIETNLDFDVITAAHRATYKTDNKFTASHLLLAIASVQEDLGLAAYLDSDITVTPMRSALLRSREVFASEHEGKARLQEFVLNDSRAIADAINSAGVPFSKVLDLADHAKQFREWMTGREPDKDVAKAFFDEATKQLPWIRRLPRAASYWLVVNVATAGAGLTVAGPAGVVAGAGISASASASHLVYERLHARWSPGQFLQHRVPEALDIPKS